MSTPNITPIRPTVAHRLIYGIPLVMFFSLVAFLPLIIHRLEDILLIMGELPMLTRVTLCTSHAIAGFPYVLMPTMYAVAWLYLAWGCRTQRRMVWFSWTVVMLCVLVFTFAILTCFVPIWSHDRPIQKH